MSVGFGVRRVAMDDEALQGHVGRVVIVHDSVGRGGLQAKQINSRALTCSTHHNVTLDKTLFIGKHHTH